MESSKYKEELKFQKILLKKARSEKDLQEVYDIKSTIKLLKSLIKVEKINKKNKKKRRVNKYDI